MSGGSELSSGAGLTPGAGGDVLAIDVHAHVLVPAAEGLVAKEPGLAEQRIVDARSMGTESSDVNRAQIDRLGAALTQVPARLAAMDAGRVELQVVSPMPVPHLWADAGLAERLSRTTNDGVLEHCARAPDRLLPVGYVPLQHPELAVRELRRAADAGFRGVQISTSAGPGRELDHPDLEPFWAAAAETGLAVLVHPWGCTLGERLDRYYLFNSVGNPTETALALSRIIFSGVLDRHPALRLWAAHGGGYLPTYLGRADHTWHVRPEARFCAEPPSTYLRRMWVDSLVYTPMGLRHLVEAVGHTSVTLGSDYPFDMSVPDPVDRLEAAGLTEEAVRAIRGENAARLLGLDLTDLGSAHH